MAQRVTSIVVLFLVALACISAQALTIGFPVTIENQLDKPVVVELAQYHAKGFDGTQPEKFTDDLLNQKRQITLESGEKRETRYNSAGGGFWLLWRVVSPSEFSNRSGMLRFIEGERTILVK